MKHTKELLEAAVSQSETWAGVCRVLGIKARGGSAAHVAKRAKHFGIDHSHFKGQAFQRGVKRGPKKPIEEYLKKDFPTSSHRLKLRLIEEGLKEHRCETCKLTEWNGQPIPIELEHKDGDHDNNLLENLEIICPNCHAQTDTHAGKGKKKCASVA